MKRTKRIQSTLTQMAKCLNAIAVTGLTAATMASCTGPKGYELTCDVPEAWEGKTVVLYTTDGMETVAIDSTKIRNGHFVMKGHLNEPRKCNVSIYLNPSNRYDMVHNFDLFLDSTAVHVNAIKEDNKINFNIEGGDAMTEWNEYKNSSAYIWNERKDLFKIYIDTYYKEDNQKAGIEATRAMDEKYKEIEASGKAWIAEHPNSCVSLDILAQITRKSKTITYQELDEIYNSLSTQLRSTEAGLALKMRIDTRKIYTGVECPDIQIFDRNGNRIHLTDLLNSRKYTLIDIWASWCAPCRGEIPILKKAYAKYNRKGFDIISISIDEDYDRWITALDQENMPWRQFNDPSQLSFNVFETGAVPTMILLNPDGKIIDLNARGGWLDADLLKIFN